MPMSDRDYSSILGGTAPRDPWSRLQEYWRLCRLDRPIGVFLLMWPTLWALWLAAEGAPPIHELVVFVLGVVLMRSAGCAMNDYADREIDPHVTRTVDRPLATGRIHPREALAVFFVLSGMALLLVLTLNTLTILLAVPACALAASYPFSKRYIHLPQAWLGASFGWAVPMAYAAVTGSVPAEAWVVFVAVVLWAMVYDTFYAMVDRDDDLLIGVKSAAILFGRNDRYITTLLQVQIIVILWMVGRYQGMGMLYFAGLSSAVGLFVYQQYLIRHRERDPCFKAFLNNNWVGVAVFAGIALDYWFRGLG